MSGQSAMLLTPTLVDGPSLGSGPVVTATFATGRSFAVLRSPGMNFGVRWRDPIPGYGTVFLRRKVVGNRHAVPVFGHPEPPLMPTRHWLAAVGWVRMPYSCYVHPETGFAAWKDALACGLSWLDAWLAAPDWRVFQNESYGGIGPLTSLDTVIAAFGMAPVAEAGEGDGDG